MELFKTEISNEQYFGGCGSFECQARCLNDGQTFFVDDGRYHFKYETCAIVHVLYLVLPVIVAVKKTSICFLSGSFSIML